MHAHYVVYKKVLMLSVVVKRTTVKKKAVYDVD
jgi:hypothetical protein